MPTATNPADGTTLRYAATGPEDREVVALVGDAGLGPWQWAWQHGALGPYRSLATDLRGTGPDAPPGPYDVDALAGDLEAVLADAGARRAHLVGFGLGGMVCLRHAREYGRARSLALVGTARSGESVDREAFDALFEAPDALAGAFTPSFRETRPDLAERVAAWRREEDPPADVREAQLAAALDFEDGALYELPTPALVLHGLADPVVPASAGESLAGDLPNGEYGSVAGRRLAHVEHSVAVNDRLAGFLEALDSAGE